MRAAYGEGPVPYEVLEAQLCERFHRFPSELDQQDAARLLPGLELAGMYDALRRQARGERLSDTELEMVGEALALELRDDQ